MRTVGTSALALGATAFVVWLLARPCTIDGTALVLILAGMSVLKGSRKGAIVALVACIMMVLPAVTVASSLARGYREVGIWQGTTVIVLGVWALVNAILLARTRPVSLSARGGQIGPSDGRPVLQFGLRSLLLLTLAVAVVLGFRNWSAPPACATVHAIQSKYSEQLARLRDVALGNAPNWTNDPTNLRLFGVDEVVSAEVGQISEGSPEPTSMSRLKHCDADRFKSSVTYLKPWSGIGQPVVYVRHDQLADGTSREVAVYENQELGKDGRTRVLYRLELDVRGLQSIADEGNSTKTTQPQGAAARHHVSRDG